MLGEHSNPSHQKSNWKSELFLFTCHPWQNKRPELGSEMEERRMINVESVCTVALWGGLGVEVATLGTV